MIIWLAMVVPVIAAVVLYFRFKRRVLWWEFLVPFAASVVLIGASKAITAAAQTHDKEYWGGWVTTTEYYEDWNETVPCSHTKYCTRSYPCGNQTCTDEYACGTEHLYDVDYHSPYWQVVDSNGIAIGVTQSRFEYLCTKFRNRRFVDLHRNYHTNDGDKYAATWDGREDNIEVVTTIHNYENRVQASSSVFNFITVDPKKYDLFEYPEIYDDYKCHSVLGNGGPTMINAQWKLDYWNARLGAAKQIRMFILVFMDKPLEAAVEQESYWKGGNKNEFILAIGVNKQHEVQWAYVISWTPVESLKIEARNFAVEQKQLDLVKIADWLGHNIREKWVRKQFADFSYITVEPPTWAVILALLLTIAINIGTSWWVVNNECRE